MPHIAIVARRLGVLLLAVAAACSKKGSGTDTTASAGAVVPDSAAPAVAVATTPTGQVALTVAAKPGEAVYLTDANGRAVYYFSSPDGKAVVECTGDCATAFDPVTGKAIVAAGDTAVKVALIGEVARPGGGTQVTYGGKPLYYAKDDQASGDTKGQGRKTTGGEASLVSPSGEKAAPRGR
jgi:predicted lipoprotein with Yx(FWY)xxD motif